MRASLPDVALVLVTAFVLSMTMRGSWRV